MSNIAIKAENLGKAYQLGQIGTGTISRDLERWYARIRGKEDPFLRIGEGNNQNTKSQSDVVWSLKDINFEIEQGDAVGIIGRNGAGKSTLLKILSKVTAPTTGKITGKGRIASLLEVGTGFHPELSGRENIFLNGAILGMRKKEIQRKLDEIVDFAGIERYLDTPVKRYSSGMYVRLAFAVAAHLESEILIVDEVLAVGDAEFQKKCLGKMSEVSKGEGRTVLFVSHNMASIASLCKNSILLNNGKIQDQGISNEVIAKYENNNFDLSCEKKWSINNAPGNQAVKLISVRAINEGLISKEKFDVTERFGIELEYEVLEPNHILWHGLNFYNEVDQNLFDSHSITSKWYNEPHPIGRYKTIAWVPENFLNESKIIVSAAIFNHQKGQIYLHVKDAIAFEIIDLLRKDFVSARGQSIGKFPGLIRPLLKWTNE
ncbi:ABC transporter ATP-binding protein [Pedobacter nototheniae]|uniref:ABC transporter ATP-binding protein n=1 Tax=Pedobacter nototheniae TaxID=2488994 RepID=UPI00103FEA6A|nr:ABC transporter ATP-binding protein [Pedobacter nototheniae]